jgi:hypothetical protein
MREIKIFKIKIQNKDFESIEKGKKEMKISFALFYSLKI